MAWKKSPARLVAAFDAALPGDPRVERRTMFGYPCVFVNGNMFAGLHQDALFVRLDQDGRERLSSLHDVRPFVPMPGRVMREYVVMPEAVVDRRRELAGWIAEALRYAAALPVKRPRATGARGSRPKRPSRSRLRGS